MGRAGQGKRDRKSPHWVQKKTLMSKDSELEGGQKEKRLQQPFTLWTGWRVGKYRKRTFLGVWRPGDLPEEKRGLILNGAPSTSLSERTYLVRAMISPLGDRGEKEYLCWINSRKLKDISAANVFIAPRKAFMCINPCRQLPKGIIQLQKPLDFTPTQGMCRSIPRRQDSLIQFVPLKDWSGSFKLF